MHSCFSLNSDEKMLRAVYVAMQHLRCIKAWQQLGLEPKVK